MSAGLSMPERIDLRTDAPRLLVVTPRRIGDVLLATPLVAALRHAWPAATIDMLVFRGTAGVVKGHPAIARVIEIEERPTAGAHAKFLLGIARRYDAALSTVPGDRPTLYARLAARCAAGAVVPGAKHAWKRRLLTRSIDYDDLDTHTVVQNLRLADLLGIARRYEVLAAQAPLPAELDALSRNEAFVVLHPYPRFRYKMWTPEGFAALGRWLHGRGSRIVLSGSPAPDERAYAAALLAQLPAGALDLSGQLSLAQWSTLLARARMYAGPDTVVTHMAAASGAPTLALFGPSNPVKWGPWPAGYAEDRSPWVRAGSSRVGNVFLLQGEAPCAPGVPCLAEGCDRHVDSASLCLTTLAAERVIAAADTLLA
jgi:heptosyltransferase III